MSGTPGALSGGSGGPEAVVGIVTVSDRASAGAYEDLSGPAVLGFFQEAIKSRRVPAAGPCRRPPGGLREASPCRWRAIHRIIPDERALIQSTLTELVGPAAALPSHPALRAERRARWMRKAAAWWSQPGARAPRRETSPPRPRRQSASA